MMKAPVGLLVVLCLVVGLLPAITYGPMVHLAATAVLGAPPPPYTLAIWHGFNLPLAMSAVALVGGVAMYWALQRRFNLHLHHPRGFTGRLLFTQAIDGLFGLAGRITARLETQSLQRHVAWTLGFALLLAAWAFTTGQDSAPTTGSRPLLPATAPALVAWLLLLAAGGALVLGHHQRLRAVVLVGVIGLVTSLAFVGLSAPDLALTQLSVEVVSTVLLLMGLALLPPTTPRESSSLRRWRDATLAIAGGAGMAWLSWLLMTRGQESISWYFLEQSLPKGGGSNTVNVILVDFRGYDTFGEITVLGIAALGVLALMDRWRVRRPVADADGRPWRFAQPPLLLQTAARVVLPLAIVVSLYIFWRGHNLPGGGFIAGLLTAVALVLQFMAMGQQRAEALLHAAGGRRFVQAVGIGLGIAWLTGVGAFVFGRPFLTSAFGHPVVPLLGELPLATAALFDLGVYITVVASTLLTLSVLGAASKDRSRP